MRRARKAVFATIATALTFGLAEVSLRLFVPKEYLLFEWERPNGLLSLSLEGTTIPRSDMNGIRQDGPYQWAIHHNADSLRESTDLPTEKPDGSTRYLALGDSWIYGWSVDQEKTIPEQIEAILTARLGHDVEVINGGVHGFCAFDMYVRWRQLQPKYEIDGVLIGMPHNIGNEASRRSLREAWLQGRPGIPQADARLYLLLRRTVFVSMMPPPSQLRPVTDDGVVGQAVADIARVVHEARSLGIGVWFEAFPTQWGDNVARQRDDDVQSTWFRAMDRIGVPVAGHRLGERSCWGYQDLAHPSEAGARTLAEVAASMILGEGGSDRPVDAPRCGEVVGIGPGK